MTEHVWGVYATEPYETSDKAKTVVITRRKPNEHQV